jgi:hypothetical protein
MVPAASKHEYASSKQTQLCQQAGHDASKATLAFTQRPPAYEPNQH